MAKSPGKYASSTELAQAFHVTSRYIQKLAHDGILTTHGESKGYRFLWTEAVWELLQHREGERGNKSEDAKAVDARKAKADADYKEAKAAQEQLELAELEGRMHSADDVQDAFEQLVYAVRSAILAVPGRAALDVVHATSSAEAAEIIRNEVNEALASLADFQYDPQFFADRVRERKGWADADKPDE